MSCDKILSTGVPLTFSVVSDLPTKIIEFLLSLLPTCSQRSLILDSAPLRGGRGCPPGDCPLKQAPPHMCYVKVGNSATKGVRINSKEPVKFGALGPAPLGWGVAGPQKSSPSQHVLPRQIW